jgi:hypothetical protein
MFIALVVERNYCYTVYANAYINETAEAVVEWILVFCGIIAPAFYAQFFRGSMLNFTVSGSGSVLGENAVELDDMIKET